MITASGGIFLSLATNRVCLQMRSGDGSYPGTWSFWGGKSEGMESALQTLIREISEEAGNNLPEFKRIYPLHQYVSRDKKFIYNSFVITVDHEFIPTLNQESTGYTWTNIDTLPKPLHAGARGVLCSSSILKKIKTMGMSTFQY